MGEYELLDVYCLPQFDPPRIRVCFAVIGCADFPKPYYDAIREPLGLPDVVCGGED